MEEYDRVVVVEGLKDVHDPTVEFGFQLYLYGLVPPLTETLLADAVTLPPPAGTVPREVPLVQERIGVGDVGGVTQLLPRQTGLLVPLVVLDPELKLNHPTTSLPHA
jgi:hypothetical protein